MPPPSMPAGDNDNILHWEDVAVGQVFELGTKMLTKEELVSYARTFDPQPMHVDEEAAKESMIGRLFASGWHSCAILMRLLCDGLLLRSTSLGAAGVDEVKFMKPVFPDEPLTGRATCKGKRALSSKPDVGTCHFIYELMNARGETALSMECHQFMRRRHPGAPA